MQIKIIYYKTKYILADSDDNMITCLNKFCEIIKVDLNDLSFKYKGKELNKELNLREYKKRLLVLQAYNLKKKKHDKNARDILCPGCLNQGLINFPNDHEINITNCKRNHVNFSIPFKEFLEMNKPKYIDVNCEICGNEEGLYGEPLDICSCGKNICPLCLLIHDPTHKSINYYDRLWLCSDHALPFLSYCSQCNIDLCENCEPKHDGHKVIQLKAKEIAINEHEIKRIEKNAKEMRDLCKIVKDEINRTLRIFNKVVNYFEKNLEGYSLLNENLLLWIKDMKNYEALRNISTVNEKNKEYKKILNDILRCSFRERVNHLLNFYDEKKRKLTIYYKKVGNEKDKGKIRIFNESFVSDNKNNCYLKIRNEKSELIHEYTFDKKYNEFELATIKIQLIIEKKMDLNRMFYKCQNLFSFDEDEFPYIDIENINNLFDSCKNLRQLPDISIINVSKIENFSFIFNSCESITSLPDISIWNISSGTSLKCMFKDCVSLLSLPDISKWNTSKVTSMEGMFSGCQSLKSLPNISVWNTPCLNSLTEMFSKCKSLTSFPELRTWDTSNLTDRVGIFKDCNENITPDLTDFLSKAENKSFLNSINFQEFCSKIYGENIFNLNSKYNKFCDGFLIISLNKNDNIKIEEPEKKSEIKDENELCSGKPEIIFKYPLNMEELFDIEDLAYSCFSTGISASIERIPSEKNNFSFSFKNKNNEIFYLFNYFTYKKIPLENYYEEYSQKNNNEKGKETNESETTSETGKESGKGFAYIPYCFCLISKYFYINQFDSCLKSIYTLYSKYDNPNDYLVLRDLILFLINSIPIPPINKEINFLIPCFKDYIKIDCPVFKGYPLLNTNIFPTLRNFNFNNDSDEQFFIVWILRLLLYEHSFIIFDKDDSRMAQYCDTYLSLLYPFEWPYTYIPILNEKNAKKIDFSSPFLIGANISMIDKVINLLEKKKIEREVILVYVYNNYVDIDLSSSLLYNSKITFIQYLKKNFPDFPDYEFYWAITTILKKNRLLVIKQYTNEAKNLNRDLQKNVINFFGNCMLYMEKTKEKKWKPFYTKLKKTKLFENYINNKESENLQYFQELYNSEIKNKKKVKLNYNFNSASEHFMINPYISTINKKIKKIKDLEKFIRQNYPEAKINKRIFEKNMELNEDDFKNNHDKIYLFDELNKDEDDEFQE